MYATEPFRVQLDIVQDAICAVCPEAVFDQHRDFLRCALPESRGCTVREKLPEVMDAIRGAGTLRAESIVQTVREQVCAYCEEQVPDGSCPMREAAACALDRHLLLVLRELAALAD
jgi:hypothetical protein